MGEIIIKCFQTPQQKYFYDRYTDSVVRVTEEEYSDLKKIETEKIGPELFNSLKKYIDNGFLQESILMGIEHPETKNICHLLQHNMSQLILQVTQQCNLRCSYCAYSGGYNNRDHSSKKMTFDVAKKAIDYYLLHSSEKQELVVGFYGGEPLLEFQLIKKCVDYVLEKEKIRKISFQMTTNGTLLNRDIVNFLKKHNFVIMISLDGPKDEHDINRKFVTGDGSFDIIVKHLERIYKEDFEFYKENITFNTIVNTKSNLDNVLNYFKNEKLFLPGKNSLNFVNPSGIKNKSLINYNEEFYRIYGYEYLKVVLAMIGKIKWDKKSKLLRSHLDNLSRTYRSINKHSYEYIKMHHNGPCIAGVRRAFINVDGKFFPCERVAENCHTMEIGNLEEGISQEKVEFFINHGSDIQEECLRCWNLRRCSFCLGNIEVKENEKITKQKLLSMCDETKKITLGLLHEICVLSELGLKVPVEEEL